MRSALRIVMVLAGIAGSALQGATPVATPSSLNFTWQTGAVLPAAQTLAVQLQGSAVAWIASTPPADQWLILSSLAGNTPASIVVRVNPSTLPPGTYNSTITVSIAGVATPVSVPVSLSVTASSSGATVAPATVSLTYPGTVTATIAISNGPGTTSWTALSSVPWLTVSSAAGVLLPAQTQTLTLTASPGALAPQTAAYPAKLSVTVTSNGVAKTQTVAVNLVVNSQTPTIASVWPAQIPVGSPDTVVTIRGTNLYAATTAVSSGAAAVLKVTVVSSSVMLATIPAPQLAAAATLNITVTNPAPGGAGTPFPISVGNATSIAAVTNAASYAQGAISAGEIITLFGQNLGPQVPVQLTVAAGYASTSIGGVAVKIDGQDAPIIYAGSSQLSVQVPYTVNPGTQALGTARVLSVTLGAGTAATRNVDIVASAPGLFTANATGTGQVLALNYDSVTGNYSVNSATAPATIGTTVILFATGEGDYAGGSYGPETGLIVPATPPVSGVYPQLNPLPTVTIGGVVATTVSYAGPIPTGLLGLLQINAVVPTGAATGAAVPVSVSLGAAQTQANLTIAIK